MFNHMKAFFRHPEGSIDTILGGKIALRNSYFGVTVIVDFDNNTMMSIEDGYEIPAVFPEESLTLN